MSIDWLPEEDRRRFPDNVYTEPCWTRTDKGILYNSKRDLKNLYDIFEIYKKKGRVIAEGIVSVITRVEITEHFLFPLYYRPSKLKVDLPNPINFDKSP